MAQEAINSVQKIITIIFDKWRLPEDKRDALSNTDDKKRIIWRIHERLWALFRDHESIAQWLREPNRSLDGKTPLEMFDINIWAVVDLAEEMNNPSFT